MNQIFALPHEALIQTLLFLYNILFQNMGFAIIALTLIIRAILVPITLPATKAQKKMMELKPHLDELKKNHGHDKVKMQEEQLKLYKEHGVNPLAGCLPYIVQFYILIELYRVLSSYLGPGATINGQSINTGFFWLNLAHPDQYFIFPVLAGATQFLLSLMMLPPRAPKIRKDDTPKEKEEKQDFAEAMQEVQGQMVYMTPIMTALISLKLPSGLGLYWVIGNIFSIIQQYYVSGLGGLKEVPFLKRFTK